MAKRKKTVGRPNQQSKRKALMDAIRTKVPEVDEKLRALFATGEADDFVKAQRSKFRALSDTKSRKKMAIGNLSKMNMRQLHDYNHILDLTLKSKWMSEEGRNEIWQKQHDALLRRGYDLTREEHKTFAQIMNSREIQEMIESRTLDSWQVLEMSLDTQGSDKVIEAVRAMTRNFGSDNIHAMKSYSRVHMMQGLANLGDYDEIEVDEMLQVILTDYDFYKLGKDAGQLFRDVMDSLDTGKQSDTMKKYYKGVNPWT